MSIVTEIFRYAGMHWIEWMFTILIASAGFFWRWTVKKIKVANDKSDSVAEGMQALLRSEIIDKYNYYKDKGKCPIYAKENIKRLYEPYKALGGNDVATKLVNEMLEMPTEREVTE